MYTVYNHYLSINMHNQDKLTYNLFNLQTNVFRIDLLDKSLSSFAP